MKKLAIALALTVLSSAAYAELLQGDLRREKARRRRA